MKHEYGVELTRVGPGVVMGEIIDDERSMLFDISRGARSGAVGEGLALESSRFRAVTCS